MRHFSSDDQATVAHPSHGGERWSLQGNLGRGRWRRWFRVAGTGEESDIEVDPEPENWASVLEIIREKQYGKRVSQFTVNQDQSAFMPLSSLEVGTERSQAICRIARYFSIDTLGELVDSIKASPNAADYQNADLLKEIFTIPEQIATEIFKGGGDPLDALKTLNESQLSKLNPIAIGTGFLVGGTHLMTNNHVISDAMEAAECVAQFNYVKDAFGGVQKTVDYELDPSFLFITNPDLDYTLVQLKAGMFTRQAGYVFSWLQLSGDETLVVPGISGEQVLEMQGQGNREPISDIVQAAKAKSILGDRVFLVQHPKGQQKQIVQNDNRVLDYDQQGLLKNFLRYTAASDYGSSGSPVFNTNWDLVALHHAVLAPVPEPEKTPRLDPPLPASESSALESEPAPVSESEPLPLHQPGQPNTSQTDQYQGQGVRICRIVEDLQAKSVNLPKLKNFIEDFIVTAENLHNTALPGALSFSGGNDQYISLDNAVGLLSASVDGTVKLWSAAGLELKTLSLDSQGMTAGIEHISFNPAGTRMAVARSPQSGQRGWIELWHLQGQTLDAMQLLKVHDLRSDRPIRDDKAAIGSLGFSDNFFGQGEVILALSTDGYLDIWRTIDGTLLTPPLDVVAQEIALLPSQSELEEKIDRLNQRISSLEQDISEELQRYWQLDQSIPNEEKQKELQRYWQLKDTLDTVKAERTKHERDLNRKNS
ncbi:MAG: trypsin-like peptidase domain-containing protein [Cyanobacteria bacterium]|nr:trypsin-like peptidase domain-containing protein [Cyanobacteriota bacterium]MDA0866434.1 trypsin-like peptidase domain-containing protein [Cyanobacteriota bacterium]